VGQFPDYRAAARRLLVLEEDLVKVIFAVRVTCPDPTPENTS